MKDTRKDGEKGKKEGRKTKDERGSYAVSVPEPSGSVGMAPSGRVHVFIHSMM